MLKRLLHNAIVASHQMWDEMVQNVIQVNINQVNAEINILNMLKHNSVCPANFATLVIW